jgi:hypothetical protein
MKCTRLTPARHYWAFDHDNSQEKAGRLWKEIDFPLIEGSLSLDFYKKSNIPVKKVECYRGNF